VVPLLLIGVGWLWTQKNRSSAAALTLGAVIALCAMTAAGRESRVHLEDPQVRHIGGESHPPPGSFFRSAHGISWRFTDGASVQIPWRPPLDQRLEARLRVAAGGKRSGGQLLVSWDGVARWQIKLSPCTWTRIELPRPARLGRQKLELTWRASNRDDPAELFVDLVEAVP
jgi:hypothetical protein